MHKQFISLKDSKNVKSVKNILEKTDLYDKNSKISVDKLSSTYNIPIVDAVLTPNIEDVMKQIQIEIPGIVVDLVTQEVEEVVKTLPEQIRHILTTSESIDPSQINELIEKLPKRYSVYTPLLLLPANTLETTIWQNTLRILPVSESETIFKTILNCYTTPTNPLTHLAINKPIPESDNIIRSPTQLTTLYGDFSDFWCHTTQNGIYQTWMPLHTMFSRGNIKEKARILTSYEDISSNMDVIDMYAGIGYFTLSYLKRDARRVFCWEINPYSVAGLAKGVKKNGFGEPYIIKEGEPVCLQKVLNSRCIIFLESNEFSVSRISELKAQETESLKFDLNISHINLGLLPTSTDSWPYTCELIDRYGEFKSWVHVHENVGVPDLDNYMEITKLELQKLSRKRTVEPIWLEKVKTFAPDVYHIVADFKFTSAEKTT